MRKTTINSFNEGLASDHSTYTKPRSIYTYGRNVRLITYKGNEFILQSELGNEEFSYNGHKVSLTPGFVPIGLATYNNVAYIISTDDKRLEIGTYPSPNYYPVSSTETYTTSTTEIIPTNAEVEVTVKAIENASITGSIFIDLSAGESFTQYLSFQTQVEITTTGLVEITVNYVTTSMHGEMIDRYYPLQNYRANSYIGDFRVPFAYSTALLEIEIQPSYDNTLNILFTNQYNSPRIVNSRVSIRGNYFEVIDRQGDNDTNIYDVTTIDATGLLVSRSVLIPDLVFGGLRQGGKLTAGNYRYYFRYSDADGNLSNLIEESRDVSVFTGTKPSNVTGDTDTQKAVVFKLNNVDLNYTYLRVYYAYYSSTVGDPVVLVKEIDVNYVLREGLEFIHFGTEPTLDLAEEVINEEVNSFTRARTMAQVRNRLFLANVTEFNYDTVAFSAYADTITAEATVVNQNVANILRASNIVQANSLGTLTETTDVNGLPYIAGPNGYYNPFNIYYSLGYRSGETYQFGIVFILNDGTLTRVFPISGGDYYTGTLDEPSNFAYRLPKLGARTGLVDNDSTKINAMKFTLPTAGLADIKEVTKGFFFVRAPRDPDILASGALVPCLKVFITTPIGSGGGQDWNHDYDFDHEDVPKLYWSEAGMSDKAVVPIPGTYLESYGFGSTAERTGVAINSGLPDLVGTGAGRKKYFIDSLRTAFYSPDIDCDRPGITSKLDGRDVYIDIAKVNTAVFNIHDYTVGEATLNQIQTSAQADAGLPAVEATAHFVISDTRLSTERFASSLGTNSSSDGASSDESMFDARTGTAGSFSDYKVLLNWDAYIGLKGSFDSTSIEDLITPVSNGTMPFVTILRTGAPALPATTTVSYNVDIYPQGGPLSSASWATKYNREAPEYFPISKRYSWDEYEAKQVNRATLEFGGDTYVNAYHKKPWRGVRPPGDDLITEFNNRYRQNLGIIFTSVLESENNCYLRTPTREDANTTVYPENTFFPRVADTAVTVQDKLNSIKDYTYKLPETSLYNLGYSATGGVTKMQPFLASVPFNQNVFTNRIYYSDTYVNSSFSNGYRVFRSTAYQDYPSNMGPIVAIRNYNDALFVVCEQGLFITPVSQRVMVSNETNPVFVETPSVLTENLSLISPLIGSQWQFSIVSSRNAIYGVDTTNTKIWKFGGSLELLSDFKVNELIKDVSTKFGQLVTDHDIVGHYDSSKNELLFSFIDTVAGDAERLTIGYQESLGVWTSLKDYYPRRSFVVKDVLFTMTNHQIWRHTLNYVSYGGQVADIVVDFYITEDIYYQKILNNLKIISNKAYPTTVQFYTDTDAVSRDIADIATVGRLYGNAHYKENHLYIEVQRQAPTSAPIKRIRDKYIRVRLIYNGKIEPWLVGDRIVQILAVQSDYIISHS